MDLQQTKLISSNPVNIPGERFEELIVLETRVNILVDFLSRDKYCEKNTILRIIGTEDALLKAAEIEEEERKEQEEYLAKRGKKDADV